MGRRCVLDTGDRHGPLGKSREVEVKKEENIIDTLIPADLTDSVAEA